MYNLFRFLVRYHLFFLFILLEIFSFYLIYQNNKYQQAAFVNVSNRLSGRVYATYQSVADYFYLRRISDSLVVENARLHAMLPESKLENYSDTIMMRDTGKYSQNYTYIPARVIRNSVNMPTNLIYLDKGSRQGVGKYMGVISPGGVVGQVINVTADYAAVRSELSKDFVISCRFKKNQYYGNVHWNGLNSTTASMDEVPKHVPVKEGDTVVTSGFTESFPRNVMVGVVKNVKSEPEKNFHDITLNLSTDFGNLSYVYVVKNLKRNELLTLDSLANK